MDFSDLLQSVNSIEEKYPPVHLWNPDLCEGVEMKIDREGNWFYQNSIIGRDKLKILFSRILKLEEGKYFLVTPVEKVPVTVDLAPYMIVDYEVDRYITWPWQALAYKSGQLKILELRAKAESELGDSFDIKDFHHEVLKRGALPLDILEKYINEWIDSESN